MRERKQVAAALVETDTSTGAYGFPTSLAPHALRGPAFRGSDCHCFTPTSSK